MIWASSSGPSMQACLRTILPSMVTGTMQAPHMPVASTMIELRLATAGHAIGFGQLADGAHHERRADRDDFGDLAALAFGVLLQEFLQRGA